MKNRQTNHQLETNSSDIYCLLGNRTGMLLAGFVLTSGFESPPPPPNVTVKYNNTLREKTLKALAVLPLLYPHVHFGLLWVFVITLLLFVFLRICRWVLCAVFERRGELCHANFFSK